SLKPFYIACDLTVASNLFDERFAGYVKCFGCFCWPGLQEEALAGRDNAARVGQAAGGCRRLEQLGNLFSETASSHASPRGATNIEYIVSVMKRLAEAESLVHWQDRTVRSPRRLANRRYSVGPNQWIATGAA